MATLHIRNVPEGVYEALRQEAQENGRSMNGAVLDVLQDFAERRSLRGRVTERLRRLAREVDLPPDAPRPEDLIREDRDRR